MNPISPVSNGLAASQQTALVAHTSQSMSAVVASSSGASSASGSSILDSDDGRALLNTLTQAMQGDDLVKMLVALLVLNLLMGGQEASNPAGKGGAPLSGLGQGAGGGAGAGGSVVAISMESSTTLVMAQQSAAAAYGGGTAGGSLDRLV